MSVNVARSKAIPGARRELDRSHGDISVTRHLHLYQPWARIVCEGVFPALVRSQDTRVRGWVGVISASVFDDRVSFRYRLHGPEFPFRAIIGVIRIDGVVPLALGDSGREALGRLFGKTVSEFYPGHYMPASDHRGFLWLLGAAALAHRAVTAPIPSGRGWLVFPHRFIGLRESSVVRTQAPARSGQGDGGTLA